MDSLSAMHNDFDISSDAVNVTHSDVLGYFKKAVEFYNSIFVLVFGFSSSNG